MATRRMRSARKLGRRLAGPKLAGALWLRAQWLGLGLRGPAACNGGGVAGFKWAS